MLLDMARPMVRPTPRDVASMADAVPIFIFGTEHMIRLLLGDSNMPMPAPITAVAIITSKMLESAFMLLSMYRDKPSIANPIVVGIRDPILSESHPAPNATRIIALGIVI